MDEYDVKEVQTLRNLQWLEDCAIRLICVLALDKFGDYVFDNAVAPVRETVAQALGMVVRHLPRDHLSRVIEALSGLESAGEWEVRHSGFLGVKYVITVWGADEQISNYILKNQLPAILGGLQDLEDDVRLVSADCLIPIVDIIAKLDIASVSKTLITCWDAFLEIDDLTASTTSVTKLLSLLYAKLNPEYLTASSLSLEKLIPRLWPFFRHNILSVRKGVVTTLHRLVQIGNCRNWIEPVLENLMRLLFQNVVLDVDDTVVQLSFELWRTIVENLDSSSLQKATVNHLPSWIGIVTTPNGSPIPRQNLCVVCHSNSLGGGESNSVPLCDRPTAESPMRIVASQCLGILASKWQNMLVNGQEVNHMQAYLFQLLTSGSATSRQVTIVLLCLIRRLPHLL